MLHTVFHSSWCESVHSENHLPIYPDMCLIKILAPAVLENPSPRKSMLVSTWNYPGWLESVHDTTLHLLIILTDDAIKYTCIWPLAWCKKYKSYNSSTPLQWFLTLLFTNQREREARKDEGLTMAQWINLNQNNRSVLAHRYSVLWEKTGPILLPLVCLTAGR